MKILSIDKYYFIKGGAERYFFELNDVLTQNGHQIIPFSMRHPDNAETLYASYFVDQVDYNSAFGIKNLGSAIKTYGRMIYSFHAQKKLESLLKVEKPDIAHIHMIDHQLSPSILKTLRNHGIPVIQTVHQYKLICPNYRLYNERTDTICEKCLDGKYYHPMIERCHKGSMLRGAMLGLEMSIHKQLKLYEKQIDLFHVPSKFMGTMLQKGGITEEKIVQLFYTIRIDQYSPTYSHENYGLYFGRLSVEKGLMTLLKAAEKNRNIRLFIAGDGPERESLMRYQKENGLDHITFLGNQSGETLKNTIAKAKFIVVPSEWYDNSPLVIYESFALGKPVICSDLGGMPELVDDQRNGFVFKAGDADDLAEKMNALYTDDSLAEQFGRSAREKAEREFSPEAHYQHMMKFYQRIME